MEELASAKCIIAIFDHCCPFPIPSPVLLLKQKFGAGKDNRLYFLIFTSKIFFVFKFKLFYSFWGIFFFCLPFFFLISKSEQEIKSKMDAAG